MRKPWWILLFVVFLAACQQAREYPPTPDLRSATGTAPTPTVLAETSTARPTLLSTLTPAGPRVEFPTPSMPATATPSLTQRPELTTPSASPTAWSLYQDCYDRPCQVDLVSPDQQHRWPQECHSLGLDVECQILFPNGQKSAIYRLFWALKWSSTNTHLLIPIGGSHDTPPGAFELWNMLTATREMVLDVPFSPLWIEWAPEDLSLFYLKPASTSEPVSLAMVDVAAGMETITRQCPLWLLNTLQDGVDYRFWSQFCDNVPLPAAAPVILSFTLEPPAVHPDESVTLRWTTSGGTAATLQQNASGTFGDAVAVPVSGTLSVSIESGQRAWSDFTLRLTNDDGQTDQGSVRLTIICPDAFFFTTAPPPTSMGCPLRPAALVPAAEQVFEHGRMIWLDTIPAASTRSGLIQAASVYVLYDAGVLDAWGVWQVYVDTWTATEPESDPALVPPTGLYQPVRGFGQVWRAYPEVRDRLGWALAPERGFQGAYQLGTDYYAQAGGTYLRTLDGNVLQLDEGDGQSGYWSLWAP
jgi:hypothetical protein